MTHVFAV